MEKQPSDRDSCADDDAHGNELNEMWKKYPICDKHTPGEEREIVEKAEK